jgi:hypothetical protein
MSSSAGNRPSLPPWLLAPPLPPQLHWPALYLAFAAAAASSASAFYPALREGTTAIGDSFASFEAKYGFLCTSSVRGEPKK